MMALRRNKDSKLLLTWPEDDNVQSYRILLRDASVEKLVAKLESPRPAYQLDLRALHAEHHYEWAVQKRSDRYEEWRYHLPYMRLFRPTDPPSPTELEWEPTGADVYRVVINDRDLDAAVVKDALIGTRYPVDWRRLMVAHEHMYLVQTLVPGQTEAWETLHKYQRLPTPPPDVLVQGRPAPASEPPAECPTIFLWTCDTEVNVRRMADPDPARAADLQIFGRDGGHEYGINFMMELLEEFNFRGTFFVDVLMEHQVGRADLERTIEAIIGRGHDVQLHLHPTPNLLFAADPSLARFAPGLTRDDRDLFRGALEHAVELFAERVGYAPVAYRSGAYHLCDAFLEVLPEFDIRIDSSLYPFKNCRTSEWMRTRTEPFWIGDVLEIPVGWMLRTDGSPDDRAPSAEQLAPIKNGTHQDAFVNYRPPEGAQAPATLVYLAHSFSFLTTQRGYDAEAIEAWNERYRRHVPAEVFERVRMGHDNEHILLGLPPDTDRIAIMTRLLHGLAGRTDVVPRTLRELYDGGLEPWRVERQSPIDNVPVWDGVTGGFGSAPLQVYSRGLLERMHREQAPA